MAEPQKPEQFNFKINRGSPTSKWLNNQRNKTRSIEFLIEWAIDNIGPGDLIDASVKRALTQGNPLAVKNAELKNKPTSFTISNPSNFDEADETDKNYNDLTSDKPYKSEKQQNTDTLVMKHDKKPVLTEKSSYNKAHVASRVSQPAILQNMID